MRKIVVPLTAVCIALACALPAHAEKWRWFVIPGGGLAYDLDSVKADIKTGAVAANTVVYYNPPRPTQTEPYTFLAERLEIECRGERHRWTQSAILDRAGGVILSRPDAPWSPMPDKNGSPQLFKRVLCLNQNPPEAKETATFESLLREFVNSTPPPSSVTAPPAAKAPSPKPVPAPEEAAAPAAKASVKPDPTAPALLANQPKPGPATAAAKPAPPKAPAAKAPTAKPAEKKAEPKLRPLTTP